jgi:DNA-binding beta-propeller fold protein YncE
MSITRLMQAAAGGSTEVNPAWNLARATVDTSIITNQWDISTAVYLQNFSISAQEATPHGLFFKPDGLKMYISGAGGDDVNEYNLSTAWDISTSVYLQNFSVAGEDTAPRGIFFKPDGTKMYMLGDVGGSVYEYNLSTAWDISTAVYLQNFSISAQEGVPQGVFFKPDGLKMYLLGSGGDDVNEYDLSTAWDISTAVYLQNFSVGARDTAPRAIFFKPDGTKMYMLGSSGDDVNEYDLSTAWDISTSVYLQNFSISAQDSTPHGLFFKPDGRKMYMLGAGGDDVNEYNVSRTGVVLDVGAQDSIPQSVFFKPDGLKMYIDGNGGDDVNEYDLSTAWDISTSVYLQNFSVGAQEGVPQGVFFKPDGLKMYLLGSGGDDVNEYDLSTAWDISTSVYLQKFSVAGEDAIPQGLFFKPDGTKLYIAGTQGNRIYEYDLSTAWDISTAVYLQNFSVGAQDANPRSVAFKTDGSKMYMLGETNASLYEYNLSTPWDISTAVYLQNFSVGSQDNSPRGVFFKPDGLKMYLVGEQFDAVYEYIFV